MGRRRRWSNSTVATVDEDTKQYAKETSILKVASAEDDQWDTSFVLEDVTVFDKRGLPANLLSVAFEGPYTVRGLIHVEPDQKDRFLKRTLQSAYISIDACVRYSVGLSEDGKSPCIWAGGQCGWFEIRPPSPEYAHIFHKMAQAVSLYYFLEDVHRDYEHEQRRGKPKKGPKKPKREDILATLDIETTLLKYAIRAGDGSVFEEVVAACDEHAPFLISQFSQDEKLAANEGKFDWRPTTFYNWLTSRHSDVVEKVKKQETAKQKPVADSAPPPESVKLLDDPPPQKALTKPPPASIPVDTKSKKSTKLTRQSATPSLGEPAPSRRSSSRNKNSPEIVDVDVQDFAPGKRTRRESGLPDATSSTPKATVAPDAATRMDIDQPDHTQPADLMALDDDEDMLEASPAQILHAAVKRLVRESEKPMKKMTYSYIKSHLYMRHKMKKYDTAGDILEYYSSELLPLMDAAAWAESGFYNELQKKAREPRKVPEHFQLDNVLHQLERRAKAEPRAPPSKPVPIRNNAMSVETPQQQQRKRGRPAGKMSSLRPSNKKRLMGDSGEGARGFKLVQSLYHSDQDIDEDDSDILEEDVDEEDAEALAAESPIPVKFVLEAEKLPDLTPKGPNGTWVCDRDEDCAFVERNPDDADGQARIEQHIEEEHQPESQTDRINLAMMEAGRGHLPVEYDSPSSFPSPPPSISPDTPFKYACPCQGKTHTSSHDEITTYNPEVGQGDGILAPFSDGTTPRLKISFYSP